MLKDLFIPHQANNYQPHILHPKRLLFHGGVAVFIKIIVLVSLLSLPASAWLTPDVLKEESNKIVALTNNLRLELGINLLKENILLDQAAFNKAQDMMVNQYFAHMSPSKKNMLNWLRDVGYGNAAAGENLAMGFSSADDVVAAWIKSKTHYANLIDPDFKEIGVSMISGVFKDHDTTMVAQYFATPKIIVNAVTPPIVVKTDVVQPKNEVNSLKTEPSIKGIKYTDNAVLADTIAPAVDLQKTRIWVSQDTLHKEKIIRVEAYLSPDTVLASVNYKDINIELTQDSLDHTKWTGSSIIAQADIEQTFSPVVLANLTAKDSSGNVSDTDINWDNFQEINPSLINQYLFIKNSSSKEAKTLVGASRIYFTLLLVVCLIALLLNIFIEIKKQHPHIIASALGLICLLILLIII